MDRYPGKKNGRKVKKWGAVFLGIFLISLWGERVYAEPQKERDSKIQLEKEEILGVLERPNVLFPVRWKDTEAPQEKSYELQRSFKEEIFDFVDMEKIGNWENRKLGN